MTRLHFATDHGPQAASSPARSCDVVHSSCGLPGPLRRHHPRHDVQSAKWPRLPLPTTRFIATSIMMSNQAKLPRLPLPALDDTLRRYLAAAKPIVPKAQHAVTAQIVRAELATGSTAWAAREARGE